MDGPGGCPLLSSRRRTHTVRNRVATRARTAAPPLQESARRAGSRSKRLPSSWAKPTCAPIRCTMRGLGSPAIALRRREPPSKDDAVSRAVSSYNAKPCGLICSTLLCSREPLTWRVQCDRIRPVGARNGRGESDSSSSVLHRPIMLLPAAGAPVATLAAHYFYITHVEPTERLAVAELSDGAVAAPLSLACPRGVLCQQQSQLSTSRKP